MKSFPAILAVVIMAAAQCPAQSQPAQPATSQPAESASDLTYHFTVLLPQYRFLETSGNASRAGEYDSLQQSLGGDLSLNFVDVPQHMTIKSTVSVISRDDYDAKSRLAIGKWLDFRLDSRSFIRHLDNNFSDGVGHSGYYADLISPDIVRTDTVPADSLLGVRRRINSGQVKVQLPKVPVKLFVKGGWQARDGTSQMQYYDMGGNGQANDTQCDNCHSASQHRTLNYTTRNLAGGAEITLGRAKLTYQHKFTSFNDRRRNPADFYGTAGEIPPKEDIPYTFAGPYTHSVLPRHETQADSIQISMAVAHHLTLNGDASYARTNNLFAHHTQNAFNADTTLAWNPVSRLRAVAQFHEQNLLNNFVQSYSLSDPTLSYVFGNTSLHRQWGGLKVTYRISKQFDVESYYTRRNITRSNTSLWPQFSSPNNTDPLYMVPASFSNVVGTALHFHGGEFWDARAGYEWTGTHSPGYVTDPRTNHRVFDDVTVTPVHWLTFSNDASVVVQRSFPVIQRTNHLFANTSFLTVKPISEWSIGGGYTYLQNNLRTDMQFANDAAVGLYTQPLVPYKELSQSYSLRTSYEVRKRLGLGVDFARSLAHSGFRPDLNPANYPVFPGAVEIAGYNSAADFANAFSAALGLGSGVVSQVNVPQTLVSSTADYRFHAGFNGGFRFNYGSYANHVSTVYTSPLYNYRPLYLNRSDLSGILRSYTVFFGRAW